MKMKTLIYRMGIAFLAICFIGCENSMTDEISYSALYADSLELKCGGNMRIPMDQSENWDTYLPAHRRMIRHLKYKDNLLSWDFTAKDLKISENIYDFVTECWMQENDRLKTGEYTIKFVENGYIITPIKGFEELSSRLGRLGEYTLNVRKPYKSFTITYRVIREESRYDYLPMWFNFDGMFMIPDGYGCGYFKAFFNHNYGSNYVMIYNCCYGYTDYVCEANYLNGYYSWDYRQPNVNIGDVVLARTNADHKHMCTVLASFSKAYEGEAYDIEKYCKIQDDQK